MIDGSSVASKIKFTDCLRTILCELFGEKESEIFAYYQKYCKIVFQVEANLVEFNPYYFKLHAAIRCFESLYLTHEDIDLFDIIPLKSGDKMVKLSRVGFFEKIRDFYEKEGRRVNDGNVPMSVLYVSSNILDYIFKDITGSLFAKGFAVNEFAEQLEVVYREIQKQNYEFTEETTVKEFFKDIIEPLYPQMSSHDQNFFWKFFRPKPPFDIE